MPEYRAFDSKGVLVSQQELAETDSAVAWGITIALEGAALIERKAGPDWVCFVEYLNGQHPKPTTDG